MNFEDAFSHSILADIDGIQVHVISKEDIIINKRASSRTKDLADVEMLEGGKNMDKSKNISPPYHSMID
ncbi:hypothetical protein AGMMS49579_04590 [Spirochaetia bacterium]|nr:hypothetical protein AGMMS49579_04590 [Spirochaetia bacterium]